VVLLHGTNVVDGAVMGIACGNKTMGHRFHSRGPITIAAPSAYLETLEQEGRVIADFGVRRAMVREGAEAMAKEANGHILDGESLLGALQARQSATAAGGEVQLAVSHRVWSLPNGVGTRADACLLPRGPSSPLDPDDESLDLTTAVGIGNHAGQAVVASREQDGMNQLGDQLNPALSARTDVGRRYWDYTGYAPVNTPYELVDAGRWQPSIIDNGHGIFRVQQFITPQYAEVTPYSYSTPDEFTSPPPMASDPDNAFRYKLQADLVLEASANMTDRQKMVAELFDDKISSLGFSALFITISQGMSLEQFVHYDFLTNLAAFDAGIAIWKEKRHHDAVRPFSAIRHLYGDSPVQAWGGPGQGTVSVPASQWRSYLPVADHPEYPSASAAFCAAHAQSSRLFLGSDALNWSIDVPQGSSRIEPGHTPQANLTIGWSTWTEFEEECGMSRFHGGVHFPPSIHAGADIGREVGTRAYNYLMGYINGTP